MAKRKHKTTHEENLDRLARVEGQVRGIRRMVEEGEYCISIITQIQAATSALQAVGRKVFHKHIEHCVADVLRAKSQSNIEEKIAEIMKVLERGPA